MDVFVFECKEDDTEWSRKDEMSSQGDYWSMTTVSLLVPIGDFARADFCHQTCINFQDMNVSILQNMFLRLIIYRY